MIEVVAGLIKIKDKYLIARRTDGDVGASGLFEFPGGKIEINETDEEALIREAREELNISINVLKYLCEYTQVYENRTVHLKLYLCTSLDDKILINSCHSEYTLVSFDEIKNYDLAIADKELYKLIDRGDL